MGGWRYKILKQAKLDQLLKDHKISSLFLEITHQSKPGYHLMLRSASSRGGDILGRLSKKQFDKLNGGKAETQPGFINISYWKLNPMLDPALEEKVITELVTKHLVITQSKGSGRNGKMYCFVSAEAPSVNADVSKGHRPRRVGGYTTEELNQSVRAIAKKWFFPLRYFLVTDGDKNYWVASNSEENALKEYWRVCEVQDIGKEFPVTELLTIAVGVSSPHDLV